MKSRICRSVHGMAIKLGYFVLPHGSRCFLITYFLQKYLKKFSTIPLKEMVNKQSIFSGASGERKRQRIYDLPVIH